MFKAEFHFIEQHLDSWRRNLWRLLSGPESIFSLCAFLVLFLGELYSRAICLVQGIQIFSSQDGLQLLNYLEEWDLVASCVKEQL